MSDGWTVRDVETGNETEVDGKADAQEKKRELEQLGMDVEIIKPESAKPDGGTQVVEADDHVGASEATEIERGAIDTDPIEWVPEHFVDKIEGVPVINRKGYCVLAERFGVSVTAEPVTIPSDTGFEYAEFRAIATTEDGQEYSGFGSAHVDRGDDAHLLAEMAETRAMKRATAWSTGIGMTALEELQGGDES